MIFTNISSMTTIATRIHELNHCCRFFSFNKDLNHYYLLIQINRLYNFVVFSSQRTHNYD
jgi:hypothetical protein